MVDIPRDPIIVIGMHRSGTSIVARMLSRCRIWMGCDLDVNHESLYFVGINKQLLTDEDDIWHRGDRIVKRISDDAWLSTKAASIEEELERGLTAMHLGISGRLSRIFWRLTGAANGWGWKDPRTTLLLPLWMRVFPEARLIGVVREPRAICLSLYYREKERYDVKRARGRAADEFGFPLARCLEIWERYTRATLRAARHHADATLLLRYEELAAEATARGLVDRLGVAVDPAALTNMVNYRDTPYDPPPGTDELERAIASNELARELGYADG